MTRSCNVKPKPEREFEPKSRKCLMCQKAFVSTHPGERVCRKCKGLTIWREGDGIPGGRAA